MAHEYEKWQLNKFYPNYYRDLYKDDQAINAMTNEQLEAHYKKYGIYEGRSPNPFFSPKYYLANYSDLREKFDTPTNKNKYFDALQHWLMFGIQEGRSGSTTWDPGWYLKKYTDVAKVYGNGNWLGALNHWLQYGIREGRPGSGSFGEADALFWKMKPKMKTVTFPSGLVAEVYEAPDNNEPPNDYVKIAILIYTIIKDAPGVWKKLKEFIGWLNPFDD